MSIPAKTGILLVRIAHGIVNIFVLIIILLLLAFGCYAMWDSGQIHSVASADRYEKYRPTGENDSESFEYLQTINKDVFAWLTVYGTNINYPMVQGQDNIRYVNTSAEGRHSLSGAIFLDHRNSPHFTDFNSIVYGHHMESKTMFGEIAMFSDKDYFDARRYGSLFFDGQEHGLEFFAFVYTDANDGQIFRVNITDREAQQAYLDLIMEIGVNIRDDVLVTADDRIILLSTCSPNSTSGRDILIGKIIGNVPDNPFRVEQANNPVITPMIDELPGLWEHTANWVKMTIGILISLLILLAIILIYKVRRNREGEKAHLGASRPNQLNKPVNKRKYDPKYKPKYERERR